MPKKVENHWYRACFNCIECFHKTELTNSGVNTFFHSTASRVPRLCPGLTNSSALIIQAFV